MSEDEKPDDKTEKDIVFYYSREHRLNRAPAAVRALHDGKPNRASFFGNKGNVVIFMSIIVIYVMIGISSLLNPKVTSTKLGANTLSLTVVREEGALGLRIQKTVPKSGEFYMGAVDISVSPVIKKSGEGEGEVPPVFGHRIFFRPTDTESFFISLPFDGDAFYVFLSTDDEQKVVRVR